MIIFHTFLIAQFLYVIVAIQISINMTIINNFKALEQYSLMLDRLLPEARKTPGPYLQLNNSKTDNRGVVNKVEFSSLMVLLLVRYTSWKVKLCDFSTYEGNSKYNVNLGHHVEETESVRLFQGNVSMAVCSAISFNTETLKFEVYLSGKGLVFEQTCTPNKIFALR